MSNVKLDWDSFCRIIDELEYVTIISCGITQKCDIWHDDDDVLSLYEIETGILHEFDSDMNAIIVLTETGRCKLVTDTDKTIEIHL